MCKNIKKEKFSDIKKRNVSFFFFLNTVSFSSPTFAVVCNVAELKIEEIEIMKNSSGKLCAGFRFFSLAALLLSMFSCNLLGDAFRKEGTLRVSFASGQEILTRSGIEIPDTGDFILTVKNSKGTVMYEGAYGEAPEEMSLSAGSYTVSIVSEEFRKPAFSSPQFGDEQCVVVSSGAVADVRLLCTQINSGIRLKIDSGFLELYPDGAFLLKSSFGKLLYSYSEKRVAYFTPGSISLILTNKGTDQVLLTKNLEAQEILELKISVAGVKEPSSDQTSKGITVAVDTSRTWLTEEYVLGGGGQSGSDILSVSQAHDMIGEEDVWVCGYIVGGDLTSSSASFEKPFSSRTNLLIGPKAVTSEKSSCLSVQLPSGELRDELNLVDNPHILGRKVCLKGDIVEAYYGIPGLKNVSEYELQ